VSWNASSGAVDRNTGTHSIKLDPHSTILVESGASPTIQNLDGRTALDSKREELQEAMEDDDSDYEEEYNVLLRSLVVFLSS
jgi:hypothetical protein